MNEEDNNNILDNDDNVEVVNLKDSNIENKSKEKEDEEKIKPSLNEEEDNNIKLNEINEDKEKELVEVKDKLLRVLAENENIRKQAEKNRIDVAKYGVQPMARELLNVVDNFSRALSSLNEEADKKTLEGFELINKEILNILEKFNVKKIEALGKGFDANYHQAMFEKPSTEYDEGSICEVIQDGYKFHERLLRPTLVGVAKAIEKKQDNEGAEEKDADISPMNEID